MKSKTHPSPGMRWHWPVIPAMRLLWAIMTPLGRPVEPLVYITTARSDGWGLSISLPTARIIHSYTIYSAVATLSIIHKFHWDTQTNKKSCINTHYSREACPALARPAGCGWTTLLGNRLCSLSSGPHRSHASVVGPVEGYSERTKKTTWLSITFQSPKHLQKNCSFLCWVTYTLVS